MVASRRLFAFSLLSLMISAAVRAETVTMSVAGGRVRFTAPSDVVRMQVEVYASSGQSLFDGSVKGNVFDWLLQDGAGARLGDGSYVCVVTVKNLGGKIAQRAGGLALWGDEVELKKPELSVAQQQATGPLEEGALIVIDDPPAATVLAHDGRDGHVTATAGALTFRTGDVYSGGDREQMRITPEGRVGIGTPEPEATLDVAGAVRASEGFEFADGTRIEAENGKLRIRDAEGKAAANLEADAAGTGTQSRIAKWTDNAGTLGDAAIAESDGLTVFGQNALGEVGPLFPGAAGAHVVEIGATGTRSPLTLAGGSGVMEFWKDLGGGMANPEAALAFGLARPGAPAGSDMVFSTYLRGSGWHERMRLTNAGGLLAVGQANVGAIPATGQGVRMMWYPAKAAFRVGAITSEAGDEWNDANVGRYSWAGGENSRARGNHSFAFGQNATTDWDWSLAFGRNAAAKNLSSYAIGPDSIAWGNVGFALGHNTEAGSFAFALGNQAKAMHFGTFVWADNIASNFASTDEGQFLIRARGGVGIWSNEPKARLEIKGGANADGSGFARTLAFAWDSGGYRHFVRTRHAANGGLGNAIDFFVNNSTDAAASTAPGTGNQFVMTMNDGKVGIGVTGPGYKLHVLDAGNQGLRVQTDGEGGTVASFASNGVFDVDAPFVPGGRMRIDGSGNVGLGTNVPQDRLDVRGILRLLTLAGGGGTQVCRNTINQLSACSSSLRYKEQVSPFLGGVDVLARLRPVSFTWKGGGARDLGFVAEEVAEVEPLLVTLNEKGEIEGVKYDRLTALLVNAVVEQQKRIEELERRVSSSADRRRPGG